MPVRALQNCVEMPAKALEADEAVTRLREILEDQDHSRLENEVHFIRWNVAHHEAQLGTELGDHAKVDSHAECA